MKAVVYVRVSDQDQVDGFSLDAQRHAFGDWCVRKGFEDGGYFADEGKSAKYDNPKKRPQFMAWLEAAERGEFDVAVVHTLDRFARNLRFQLEAASRLSKANVGFASIVEEMDFTTPHGKLFFQQMGAFNEFFSSMLGVHVRKGLHERARQGLGNGPMPFGYERCGEGCPGPTCAAGIHIVEEEAVSLREVFGRYASGGVTLTELADYLNQRGHKTRNIVDRGRGAEPQLFTGWSVRDLLDNPFYAGKVRWHRTEVFEGQQQAIIPEDLFEAVRLMRQRPARAARKPSRSYLLRGLLSCALCGEQYWCETAGYSKAAYYRGSRRTNVCACSRLNLRCEEVDAQVGLLVYSLSLPEDWLEQSRAKAETTAIRLESRRRDVAERRRRLNVSYLDGRMEDSEYGRRSAQLDIEEAQVSRPVDESNGIAVANLLENINNLWLSATLEERRQLLMALVDRVFVDDDGQVVGLSPKPVAVPVWAAMTTKPDTGIEIESIAGDVVGVVETGGS